MSTLSVPTITFREARAAEACPGSYRRMARHVGGITRYGADTPLPIATVLDVLGLEDALWALDAAGYHRVVCLWACDCAERVLPIFERERPGDRRPREAIRVFRLYARGLATEAALAAAQDDASDAVSDTAWGVALAVGNAASAAESAVQDAAQDAARYAAQAAASDPAASDAARDAERAWQIERLRAYLEGEA